MVNRFVALLLLVGWAVAVQAQTVDAVMLKYMVSEQGLEPYPSRIIVTDKMVRMDDGEPQGDYLLFDREKQLISSVNHEEGTVFEIPARLLPMRSPIVLKRNHSLEADAKAPLIAGRQPHQLRLFVNDQLCYDAVVVPGMHPEVVRALTDYRRVLAGEQGKLLDELPSEVLDGCDLALHTFYPGWPLESGLAIQEFDLSMQRGRLLVDMDADYKVEAALLSLPGSYRHYSAP